MIYLFKTFISNVVNVYFQCFLSVINSIAKIMNLHVESIVFLCSSLLGLFLIYLMIYLLRTFISNFVILYFQYLLSLINSIANIMNLHFQCLSKFGKKLKES